MLLSGLLATANKIIEARITTKSAKAANRKTGAIKNAFKRGADFALIAENF